jgi:hypothetical protein
MPFCRQVSVKFDIKSRSPPIRCVLDCESAANKVLHHCNVSSLQLLFGGASWNDHVKHYAIAVNDHPRSGQRLKWCKRRNNKVGCSSSYLDQRPVNVNRGNATAS